MNIYFTTTQKNIIKKYKNKITNHNNYIRFCLLAKIADQNIYLNWHFSLAIFVKTSLKYQQTFLLFY